MNIPSLHAVILGAGRPVRGQWPAALVPASARTRTLDWQRQALGVHCASLVFVAGYRLADIAAAYPDLPLVVNPEWAATGAVGSLVRALRPDPWPHLVSYADVLYREGLVQRLCDTPGDNVIVVDSTWRQRYDRRAAADADEAEVVCMTADGLLEKAWGRGDQNRLSEPQAEFIGLARLGRTALARLLAWSRAPETLCWDLPTLFNALVEAGEAVHVLDCHGAWAELNAPQDVARFVLGTKAETLERLRPMVRCSQIGAQVAFTAGEWSDAPDACLRTVRQTFGAHRLAVRSSAIGEDSFGNSAAGRYLSVLSVDGTCAPEVQAAVEQVITSFGSSDRRHQVLVQRMVNDIAISGVVMTRTLDHGAPYYTINYDTSADTTDAVTSGRGENLHTWVLSRAQAAVPAAAGPAIGGLMEACAEIETLVSHDSLDIEFIVSTTGVVHVLQVRPIAVHHAHWQGSDELVAQALAQARQAFIDLQAPGPFVLGRRAPLSVMSDWNPAEMIGTRPRRLAFSLYESLITRDIWSTQRAEYGYRAIGPQPLMRSLAGHAFIDVRASFNSFVPADLDDRLAAMLIDDGLDRLAAQPALHDKVEFALVFSGPVLDLEARTMHLRQRGLTDDDLVHLRASLAALFARGIARLPTDLAALNQLTQRQALMLATSGGPLRQALLLLEDCRQHGVLPFAHLARAAFIAINLLRSAVDTGVISEDHYAAFLQSVNTVAAEFRTDSQAMYQGLMPQDVFLARYGHLRPGTYDITVPSYAEAPSRYLDAPGAAGAANTSSLPVQHKPWPPVVHQGFLQALATQGLQLDTDTLEAFLRGAIAGRELGKFLFSRSVSLALDRLVQFGAAHGLSREDLSHLRLDDLRAVDLGDVPGDCGLWLRERVAEGRLANEVAQGVELPPLLLHADDFAGFLCPPSRPSFIGAGVVTAPVVLVDAAACDPRRLAGCIALARQADPGHDWLFAHGIAGLVTAFGGGNSHMAIRTAEFGLPAAIGVGETRFQSLLTARRLRLDCQQRSLTVLP